MICGNCDHPKLCHEVSEDGSEDDHCFRLTKNFECACRRYVETQDIPGPEVVFGAGAQDLSPVFQDMIKRMINPNKLTE